MSDQKKELERHILTKFVSNEKLKLPVTSIDNSETPDFSLKIYKDRKISIELTRLINPNLKKIESFNDRIIKKAQERFDKEFNVPLRVLVTFSDNYLKCSKLKSQHYSNEIFEIVKNIYLNNKNFDFRVSTGLNRRPFNNYIDSLHIDNEFKFSSWQTFGAYLVEYVDFKWLSNVITKKSSNIEKYNENFDENWLVLVSEFGTKSSAHRFDYINQEKIKSQFDKIYIYKFYEDKIIELKNCC